MNLKVLLKFLKKYKLNVKLIDASKILTKKLKEFQIQKKKKIIGNLFIKVFEKSQKYNNIKYLAQGTLYPDVRK